MNYDSERLNTLIEKDLYQKKNLKYKKDNIHGLIVPHAGYEFSGKIAGKAFSYLKKIKNKKAVIISPSHYFFFKDVLTSNKEYWKTPLGNIKITKNNFKKANIEFEHAIYNQIPFLQKLKFKEILPLVVGEISNKKIKRLALELSKMKNFIFIISSDLSHFLEYSNAVLKDKKTIKTIESLDSNKLLNSSNSACGLYPLLILFELCKIKKWKPKLIEYKNSGDIMPETKNRVVGYASFIF
jgi:MEMO1 family protein